jgi:GTP pyrophosphokinase
MILSERFDAALLFASSRHRNQCMKKTEIPYMAHILGVAGITALYGGTEDEIIAALLHDVVEDTAATFEDVEREFGPAVRAIVEACTDTDMPENKPPWLERKRAHVKAMCSAPDPVRLVYAADKLQNARAMLKDYRVIGDCLWKRFKGGKAGTLWYYRALIDVFRDTSTSVELVNELTRTINDLELLAYRA